MSTTGLRLYNETVQLSSATIIRQYSTSFGWASKLLDRDAQRHIANVYGLVRIADEIVDGAAEAAGLDADRRGVYLDDLEHETERAIAEGYSTNPIVHAYAITAREHGITSELTRPFFASMRTDLHTTWHDDESLSEYIYGSAEVIGLMCLAVFEGGQTRSIGQRVLLESGARSLGAAFQKINFLRDLASDSSDLGRSYFPQAAAGLNEAAKAEIIESIRGDLRCADASIPLLADSARPSVWAARAMFGALTNRIESMPAATVMQTRARVPNGTKLRILGRALRMKATR